MTCLKEVSNTYAPDIARVPLTMDLLSCRTSHPRMLWYCMLRYLTQLPCQRSPERHSAPSVQEQSRFHVSDGSNPRRERLAPVSPVVVQDTSAAQVGNGFSPSLRWTRSHRSLVVTPSPWLVQYKNDLSVK